MHIGDRLDKIHFDLLNPPYRQAIPRISALLAPYAGPLLRFQATVSQERYGIAPANHGTENAQGCFRCQ
jgi:hypothetical protein